MGKKAAALWILLIVCDPLIGGKTIRIGGNGFSFSITEPDGWQIDFRGASQIANFVMHPEGSDWRQAPVVVFARFTPRGSRETLESFADKDAEEFQKTCLFYEIQNIDLSLKGVRKFLSREHSCPSVRNEIVAVTEVPGFFVTFVLSSDRRDSLQGAVPPFQEMLSSFDWADQAPTPAPSPSPRPRRH